MVLAQKVGIRGWTQAGMVVFVFTKISFRFLWRVWAIIGGLGHILDRVSSAAMHSQSDRSAFLTKLLQCEKGMVKIRFLLAVCTERFVGVGSFRKRASLCFIPIIFSKFNSIRYFG